MIDGGFGARADIVGERVQLRWSWRFASGEGPADVPPVVLRRKRRDFEFPAGGEFVVYDDAAFPPPDENVTVTELDLGTTSHGDEHAIALVDSVARDDGGDWQEMQRRTVTTTFAADGVPTGQLVQLLDCGGDEPGAHEGLEPGISYYYELRWTPAGGDPQVRRAIVRPGRRFGSGRVLYDLLPEFHRRHDTIARPDVPSAPGMLEAAPRSGQLRRFLDVFGAALDALRSSADGLRTLHDVPDVDARYLPLLAESIGWRLDVTGAVPDQRHQIRYAARLYRRTGTVPGVLVWVKRLTGWDAELREFATNVLFSNDLGNPDDVRDTGSRTVDTASAALLAAIGTARDEVDYTYDTGPGPDVRYAYNVVGIFVRPAEPPEQIARKRSRLLGNTNLYLPMNMRAVVVVDAETIEHAAEAAADLPAVHEELG